MRSAIENELDKLVQELSHGKRCYICNRPAFCMHHLIRRDDQMLRYEEINLMPVCKECHDEIHRGHIDEFRYLPAKRIDELMRLKRMSYKNYLIFDLGMTEGEYFKAKREELRRKRDENH